MSLPLSEADVLEACRILFGGEASLSRDFLFYLQPSGAKTAYRQKAKESHPDLYQGEDVAIRQHKAEIFRQVNQAYKLVSHFLDEREKHPGRPFRFAPGRQDRRSGSTRDGYIPPRVLEIGLFLYYRRIIPFRTLAEALVWQRRQRPAIGQIARRWGWLDDDGLARIASARIPFVRFGEKAVRLGLLTPAQVRTLLFYQRSRQQRIGQYFIDQGLLSAEEMERLAEELRRHNAGVRQPE